jgi:UrcA family protein
MTIQFQRTPRPCRLGACLTLAASLALAGAAAAQPDEVDASRSVHVNYADLNLRSDEGARVMLSRIDSAAILACGGAPDLRMLDRRALFNRCKARTFDRAVSQLHSPLVTSVAGETGIALVLAGR